ncbi:MAG: hypothetical protein Q9190_004703 [Brigantiaea leucoxantha]
MKKRPWNPIGFTPLPVTIISSTIYAALFIALLVVHIVVPQAPSNPTPLAGINLTEAWQDLQTISAAFHPYNSRKNDEVRDWLLQRITALLEPNDPSEASRDVLQKTLIDRHAPAIVFSDMTSNVTFSREGDRNASGSGREPGISVYFEGTNIFVYIRGSEESTNDWWNTDHVPPKLGGVLVNAHYDSVSTGYGATDTGIGVVSLLQIIRYFTRLGHTPKRGLVVLFNNGEEDFLNGARAFSQHPMSTYVNTFLNLEGAGAGGRASMFRSTDTEVTAAYRNSRHPFANVISGDAFNRGLIKSQTDYVVFQKLLGARGLDIAFMEPRARYHTDQDDSRHTSIDSLWHMLSAALSTLQALTSDLSLSAEPKDGKRSSGRGTNGVWFDLFGEVLAYFELHTLFALSVTLLVVAPIVIIVIALILRYFDKNYLFVSEIAPESESDGKIPLYGWRGFSRYPFILVLPCAAVVGLAYLLTKINPFIIYSSPYAVWSMMLSAWTFVAWFVSCVADFWRPSALHRAFSLLWLLFVGWIVLIVVTISEQHQHLAGGYFLVFYFAAVFLATLVSFLEFFGLSQKSNFARDVVAPTERRASSQEPVSDHGEATVLSPAVEQHSQASAENDVQNEGEAATEATSLLQDTSRTTFAHYRHQDTSSIESGAISEKKDRRVYTGEQAWSWSLPTWTWLLQFLLLAPVPVVLTAQIGLLFVSAIHQTTSDGSSFPFIHRYTYHIPTFLLLVFVGTVIYNLLAFPFSSNQRLKVYFQQNVDLDTGITKTILTGTKQSSYLLDVVKSLPSTKGKNIECIDSIARPDLKDCSWSGIPPKVVHAPPPREGIPPEFGYHQWLDFNVTRQKNNLTLKNEAFFALRGRNSRACKLIFNSPITDFTIHGAGDDDRFQRVPEEGSKEIRLWSREWENTWRLWVKWNATVSNDPNKSSNEKSRRGREIRKQSVGTKWSWSDETQEKGLDGKVVCLWSDANALGVIPALDEMWRFLPIWAAVSKTGDGLVEGQKSFLI